MVPVSSYIEMKLLMADDAEINNLSKEVAMKTSKPVKERKNIKIPDKISKDRNVKQDDDLIDLFPLPRYFQVHFQHVHENTHNLQGELAQLKDYVVKVDEKLERLMTHLSRSPEHVL
jgi:flagellar basal body rod protein FlgF